MAWDGFTPYILDFTTGDAALGAGTYWFGYSSTEPAVEVGWNINGSVVGDANTDTGSFQIDAMLRHSWKAPSLTAPSPKNDRAT